MTQQHPITPPPELALQWINEYLNEHPEGVDVEVLVVSAAQWGADQELEACCEEMKSIPSPLGIPFGEMASNALRAARRPKPPSLKEQAQAELKRLISLIPTEGAIAMAEPIRRALEQLND